MSTAAGSVRERIRPSLGLIGIVALMVLVLVLQRPLMEVVARREALQAWMTVFIAMVLQAVPFLVLGVLLSAAIAVLVPADALTRWLPRRPAYAVPVAALSGAALPGCECASVPVAGSLVRRGLPASVALTFLLAAPSINPIVIISTVVAFPGRPEVALARFVASLLTAVAMGWLWLRLGRDDMIRLPHQHGHDGDGRVAAFVRTARHDLLHAGGFLVVGAAVAACVNTLVPRSWISTVAGNLAVSVLLLALLAVVVAICSEADAFVAAGLSAFPLTARLAFMVVGPAIDVKLFAMQLGTFGRRFALRFAPLTLVTAVASAVLVGTVLL